MAKWPNAVLPARTAALTVLGLSALVGACASQPSAEHRRACPDQKPDACTMNYDPVIGYSSDGEDQGVFSNHCRACREKPVDYTVPKDKATP
jgi:hypothetical protein